MIRELGDIVGWLVRRHDPPEWRPARIEVSEAGFSVERPGERPNHVAWESITALTLAGVDRRAGPALLLLVRHHGGEQPVLSTWGNVDALSAALSARLTGRVDPGWLETMGRRAWGVDIEIPLPSRGLARR